MDSGWYTVARHGSGHLPESDILISQAILDGPDDGAFIPMRHAVLPPRKPFLLNSDPDVAAPRERGGQVVFRTSDRQNPIIRRFHPSKFQNLEDQIACR